MVTFYPDASCWAWAMAHAALISPMWLNACGKFPDHLAAGRADPLGQQANIRFQSPHGRFGRRQPGPQLTGSPPDRAIGSRCSKASARTGDPPHAGHNTTVVRVIQIFPNDPWYHLLAPEALSRCS